MSVLRYIASWIVCWDRPWAAHDAMLGAIVGQVFCPCGNCNGKRLPKLAQRFMDERGIEIDAEGTFRWRDPR